MAFNPQNPNGQATMANSAPVVIASDQSAVPVSGTISVTGVATASNQTSGSQKTQLVDSGGTNLGTTTNPVSIQPPASGVLQVSVANTGANSTAIKVDGSASTQPVSGTVTVQQATASSLNATVVQGTATNLKTQAESYQGGTAVGSGNPLQVTLANTGANATAVKVDGSAVTQPVSGTVSITANSAVNVAQVGGVNTSTGNGVAGTGVQRVAIASDNTAFTVNSNAVDATASGNITTQNLVPAGTATAGSAVEMTVTGQGTGIVQVTGTYTGALSLQGTVDGSTWVTNSSATFTNINTGAVTTTIASAATDIFQFDVGAFNKVRITGLAAMTGTAVVTMRGSRSSGFVAIDTALPAGTNIIGALSANQSTNIAQINGVTPLMGNGTTGTGSPRVTLASDGTAISTAGYMSVKIDQTTSGTTNGVVPIAGTAGGASISYAVSAASNNKTQAKGSAGQVYSISVQNISSAPVYLKMFDNTSAGVTAGTTACTYQFMCPANSTAANGAGIVHEFPVGINHATGITWMLTTGISSTDNTSTSANIAIVTIAYK